MRKETGTFGGITVGYTSSGVLTRDQAVSRESARDYLTLTKPRITLLIVITTLSAMWVAQGGPPAPGLTLITLLGTALASASAATFNHYLERDRDALMVRTAGRPLPDGRIDPSHALFFGFALGILSFAVLAVYVNLLAAVLATAGILYYSVFYTLWLKPNTAQNIVIGGAAGSVGPLIGWAAVTGTLGVPALLLFAVIFFWSPPHFWALALLGVEEYEKAGLPMLPVVAGEEETRRQIFIYSWVLVLVATALYPFSVLGTFYLVTSLFLGAAFLYLAWRLLQAPGEQNARRLFAFSILYLFLLFAVMIADVGLFA